MPVLLAWLFVLFIWILYCFTVAWLGFGVCVSALFVFTLCFSYFTLIEGFGCLCCLGLFSYWFLECFGLLFTLVLGPQVYAVLDSCWLGILWMFVLVTLRLLFAACVFLGWVCGLDCG